MNEKGILLDIETDDFVLSFTGTIPKKNSFVLRNFRGGREEESMKATVLKSIMYKSEVQSIPLVIIESNSSKYNNNINIEVNTQYKDALGMLYLPLFFENITYQAQLLSKNNKKYTLWHEHSTINSNMSYFSKQKSFSGTFNFRNNVGISNFYIKEDDNIVINLTFTVFSIKIDFWEERHYMIEELSKVNEQIIQELFKQTKSQGISEYKRNTSGLEWLVNFYNLSDELLNLLKRIEKKAHNKLNKEIVPSKTHKINKPNNCLRKQINKFGKKAIMSRSTIHIEKKKNDWNTDENKYIKFLMKMIIRNIKSWVKYINNNDSDKFKRIKKEFLYEKITYNLKKMENIQNNVFWSKVENQSNVISNKTNFMFHSEFVSFEKICRIISKALALQMKGTRYIYTLSMDDLYEFWTFCKLAEIIGHILHNDEILKLKIKKDAFSNTLKKGRASEIKINDNISIATNRLFTKSTLPYFSPLVNQKPDLIFEIKNNNELNIFDAKYKINIMVEQDGELKPLNNKELISKVITNDNFIYAAKEEDINIMHRYRDAIRIHQESEGINEIRAVNKGIILYPAKPSSNETPQIKKYMDSLNRYNIGAIPLAPGKKDEEWIDKYTDVLNLIYDSDNYFLYEQIRILALQVSKMLE